MRGLFVLLLIPLVCLAADAPGEFAFGVPVELEGQEALYEVEIPASVYQGVARPDLADLRMFNGAGEPVPFALEPPAQRQSSKPQPVPLPSFPLYGERSRDLEGLQLRVEKNRSGTVVSVNNDRSKAASQRTLLAYLVDASGLQQPYEALELDWAAGSSSFATNLRVEVSNDLKSWSTVVAQAPLVRVEFGGQRLEQRTIEFAPQTARYLRLSWPGLSMAASTGGDEPIEFTKVSVRTAQVLIEPQRNWREVVGATGNKTGEYLFDLGGQFPVDRVGLALPQENTIVNVEFLSRQTPAQDWRSRSAAVAYRLTRHGEEVTSPDLAIGSTGDRYWLMRVDQKGGGLGSGLPSLKVGWVPRTLVFAARGPRPFQIAYGSRTAKPTALPVETVVPGWHSAAQLKLARARTLPERLLGGTAVLQRRPDYKVWSLWAVLVLGVTLLGWMAWRLVRQMQAPLPQESKEHPGA